MDKKNIFRELDAGELLFSEGDEGWEMFIVISGSVQVFLLRDGLQIILANLGPGHFFGEMSLLEGETRSASVAADKPAKLLVINHDNFQQFICSNPSLAVKLMKGLSGRLRRSNEQITRMESELLLHGKKMQEPEGEESKAAVGLFNELSADELERRLRRSLQSAHIHQMSCPVCHNNFKSYILQDKNLTKHTRDFWLRDRYEGLEPLLFRNVCCRRCFFAAPAESFLEIGQLQKERLKNEERMRRSKVALPEEEGVDYDHAIGHYRLALLCLEDTDNNLSLLARLALELSWLCREAGKSEAEGEALRQAGEYLERAAERLTLSNVEKQNNLYLQGLVNLRLGDLERGKDLLGQALSAKELTVVRLMAHQIMEKIKENQPLPL